MSIEPETFRKEGGEISSETKGPVGVCLNQGSGSAHFKGGVLVTGF